MSEQPNMQPVRERLTKLFEFLKAYIDLRYPPVRDIAQQPHFLWLKDLPTHTSVELFRDAGKPTDEAENNDIVLRLTRPAITRCPSSPAGLSEHNTEAELADWRSGRAEDVSSTSPEEKTYNSLRPDNDVDWVVTKGPSTFRRLRRCASENSKLQESEQKLLYWTAHDLERKKKPTPSNARKVRRIFEKAVRDGFAEG
jgi:hypothetical protein